MLEKLFILLQGSISILFHLLKETKKYHFFLENFSLINVLVSFYLCSKVTPGRVQFSCLLCTWRSLLQCLGDNTVARYPTKVGYMQGQHFNFYTISLSPKIMCVLSSFTLPENNFAQFISLSSIVGEHMGL